MNNLWSVRAADSAMERRAEYTDKWSYDYGVLLKGIEDVYLRTHDQKYFKYIERTMDGFINLNGDIPLYKNVNNIDHINLGKSLLFLYNYTRNLSKEQGYLKALVLIRSQLQNHPRTKEGVFWHKQIYPWQIWLDGIYMCSPFYAQFTYDIEDALYDCEEYDDVARQILLSFKYLYNKETKLMHHAIDESLEVFWCDKETGLSKNYWGRSIGWYAMACVDALEYMPEEHKDRAAIIEIFQKVVDGMLEYRDTESNVWYQVVDMPNRKGNYKEATVSNMMVYAIAKGINDGHLPREKYLEIVKSCYQGILDEFITVTNQGLVNVNKNCQGAGLGPADNITRDGSFAYYISENIVTNAPFGVGAFILASVVIEKLDDPID